MILNLLISVLLFADELYYEYAANIISVMQAGNLQYKDEIMVAIPSLLKIRQILYFIDFPILFGLLISKKVKVEKRVNFKIRPVLASFGAILILITYYHFIPESLELVEGYIYNKQNSVRYGTIYGYHFVDVRNAITHNQETKYDNYDDMIEVYNEFKEKQNENNPINEEYVGIAEGKNVIVLQLESVQNFVTHKTINGKEITPNLNRFFDENIEFTNMHANCYTTTADSEHSILTSLYPLENGEAFSKYYGNTYDDLFGEFKAKGYYNMYAHGNHGYFWNRDNVTKKLDVDKKWFLEDFDDTSELIRTYLSDELLYKQTVEYFAEAIETHEEPIFFDIVAASSHKPFELAGIKDKYSKVNIDIGEYEGTDFGNYLEACNYADYAFGIFIDLLKEKGLYEDTVIIVFGDHYGMQMYDENLIKFLGEDKNNYNDTRMQLEFTNVLAGMRIPGKEKIKITEPITKHDFKPTLAQICGLEDKFSMGTSFFNRNSYVSVNNGKVITSKYFYNGSEWRDIKTDEKVEEDETLKFYRTEAIKELDISNSVMVHNLLQNHLDSNLNNNLNNDLESKEEDEK